MNKQDNLLSPEQLADVNGGLVVADEKKQKYWFVKPDGSSLQAPSEKKAKEYAKSYNASPKVYSREEFKQSFGKDVED